MVIFFTWQHRDSELSKNRDIHYAARVIERGQQGKPIALEN